MAQWVNRLRNNIFVSALPLPLLCEISGALHHRLYVHDKCIYNLCLHLAQPGLMVRPAGWLAGR